MAKFSILSIFILGYFTNPIFSQAQKQKLNFNNIYINFDPYSIKLSAEGSAKLTQLKDSLKKANHINGYTAYLTAFLFDPEREIDSFINAKRLALVSYFLFDSARLYFENIYCNNNYNRAKTVLDAVNTSRERQEALINKYAGVFITLTKNKRQKKLKVVITAKEFVEK